MDVLYAYVDGSDLEEIEHRLEKRFADFIQAWKVGGVSLVNDRDNDSPGENSSDLPDWTLGLNTAPVEATIG